MSEHRLPVVCVALQKFGVNITVAYWYGVGFPAPAYLTLLGPQSRFGGTLLEIRVVCPQNETAVQKELSEDKRPSTYIFI